MLVHLRVTLAFPSTGFADGCARLELDSQHVPIRIRLAGKRASCRLTEIGAVEVQANAAPQHLDVRFGDAGVGARGARKRAIEAGVEALA